MIPSPPTKSYWDASAALRAIVGENARLVEMGKRAAHEVAPLAAEADRNPPRLVPPNRIEYHPSYRAMEEIAYGSGMVCDKYAPSPVASPSPLAMKNAGAPLTHSQAFGLGYLFAMAEMGLYCPVCMTHGVARVLNRRGLRSDIVPRLGARDAATRWTGAMFVTEKAGGSDVGANETIARNGRLTGLKWFCSNVDAQAVLVTARSEGASAGTKGLRTYLLLPRGNPGFQIERLKDKLGVRSMPTGEVRLTDAPAEEIGGFDAMLEMMNFSRLYNAVASVAIIGRAIYEARSYIEQRLAFGKRVIEHPLAAATLAELESKHLGALLMTFETIRALERADAGDEDAARLHRILVPVVKAFTGKLAVACVSEAMEMIGGNAFVDDSPLPRMLRDAQVLPIWEGTTNILCLDALRVARKEGTHELLARDVALPEERDARKWAFQLAETFQRRLVEEFRVRSKI